MLPPGHYGSTMGQMRPQMAQQGAAPPYGYPSAQSMPAPPTSQSTYNMQQSSPQFQMLSNHPPQSSSSLEQLEKVNILPRVDRRDLGHFT